VLLNDIFGQQYEAHFSSRRNGKSWGRIQSINGMVFLLVENKYNAPEVKFTGHFGHRDRSDGFSANG